MNHKIFYLLSVRFRLGHRKIRKIIRVIKTVGEIGAIKLVFEFSVTTRTGGGRTTSERKIFQIFSAKKMSISNATKRYYFFPAVERKKKPNRTAK